MLWLGQHLAFQMFYPPHKTNLRKFHPPRDPSANPAPRTTCLPTPTRCSCQVIQRKGIDPTWTVQMVAAIHISLDEARSLRLFSVGFTPRVGPGAMAKRETMGEDR